MEVELLMSRDQLSQGGLELVLGGETSFEGGDRLLERSQSLAFAFRQSLLLIVFFISALKGRH